MKIVSYKMDTHRQEKREKKIQRSSYEKRSVSKRCLEYEKYHSLRYYKRDLERSQKYDTSLDNEFRTYYCCNCEKWSDSRFCKKCSLPWCGSKGNYEQCTMCYADNPMCPYHLENYFISKNIEYTRDDLFPLW